MRGRGPEVYKAMYCYVRAARTSTSELERVDVLSERPRRRSRARQALLLFVAKKKKKRTTQQLDHF